MLNRLPNQQTSLFSRTGSLKGAEQFSREAMAMGSKETGVPTLIQIKQSEKASILLIDDETGIRALLSNALTTQGYQCQEASDGLTGLALLQVMQPDLVLLDITMPGLDGLAVLKEIRRQDPTVGVIMVSALNPARFAGKASADGADGYIQKPFRTQTIFQEIERVSYLVHLRRCGHSYCDNIT